MRLLIIVFDGHWPICTMPKILKDTISIAFNEIFKLWRCCEPTVDSDDVLLRENRLSELRNDI